MDAEAPKSSSSNGEVQAEAKSFKPSRGRVLTATAASGAAQNQPSGKALPQLILPTPLSPQEHMAKALTIDITSVLLALSHEPGSMTAAYNCLSAHETVIKRRTEALSELKMLGKVSFSTF